MYNKNHYNVIPDELKKFVAENESNLRLSTLVLRVNFLKGLTYQLEKENEMAQGSSLSDENKKAIGQTISELSDQILDAAETTVQTYFQDKRN